MHEGLALHRPDGLADSLPRAAKTAPDKKEAPASWRGHTGPKDYGRCPPALRLRQPCGPIQAGRTFGRTKKRPRKPERRTGPKWMLHAVYFVHIPRAMKRGELSAGPAAATPSPSRNDPRAANEAQL